MTATVGTYRNSDLPTLAQALTDQRTRAVDVVAPASKIRASGGAIVVEGVEPLIGEDGVTDVNGVYRPTRVAEEGIATKLDIPLRFLARSRDVDWQPDRHPECSHDWASGGSVLWDHNVNAILATQPSTSYLLRMLKHRDGDPGSDGADGVLRAVLSDRYRCIDNFDVLLAALDGLAEAGQAETVEIDGDLTDRKMIVRVRSTTLAVLAPKLLENYRSPFGGEDVGNGWTPERVANASRHEGQSYAPGAEPIVFAGFVFSNSEVGNGALDMRPRLSVRVCRNGMVINAEAMRKVHLGGRLEEGAIRWSDATVRANLALVKRQVADAAATWLSADFLTDQVEKIEAVAGQPIEDAPKVIEAVSKQLGFSEDTAKGILSMFVRGGDMTASGVMHAVTAHARTVDDGDAALELEMAALPAMAYAANA